MTWLDALLLIAGGLFAGFMNTVAGGGSLITLPLLISLNLPAAEANGSNRLALLLQNIFAVRGFQSQGLHVFRQVIGISLMAMLGAAIGAQIAVDISDRVFNRILAVVMLLVLALTFLRPLLKLDRHNETQVPMRWPTYLAFFLIGIYGGFVQAGVGFLIIAALSLLHGFGMAKINAIKVMVILAYTLTALSVFLFNDKVNWAYGLTLAIGNSTGAYFTSRWSVHVSDRWIRIILTIAVTSLAIKLWFF